MVAEPSNSGPTCIRVPEPISETSSRVQNISGTVAENLRGAVAASGLAQDAHRIAERGNAAVTEPSQSETQFARVLNGSQNTAR